MDKKDDRFAFPDITEFTLTNVNTRKENHGKQHVQAVDLSLRGVFQAEVLERIEPGLHAHHYHNPAADAGQEEVPGVPPVLPDLRFPALNSRAFKYGSKDRLTGYSLDMDYGLGEEGGSNIVLEGCKVNDIKYETAEEGIVTLDLKVQYAGAALTQEVCGALVLAGGEKVHLKLLPPALDQPQPAPGNPFPVDNEPEPQASAEDLFIKTGEQEPAALH